MTDILRERWKRMINIQNRQIEEGKGEIGKGEKGKSADCKQRKMAE